MPMGTVARRHGAFPLLRSGFPSSGSPKRRRTAFLNSASPVQHPEKPLIHRGTGKEVDLLRLATRRAVAGRRVETPSRAAHIIAEAEVGVIPHGARLDLDVTAQHVPF